MVGTSLGSLLCPLFYFLDDVSYPQSVHVHYKLSAFFRIDECKQTHYKHYSTHHTVLSRALYKCGICLYRPHLRSFTLSLSLPHSLGRRLNGFQGLSLNDRTNIFLQCLSDIMTITL